VPTRFDRRRRTTRRELRSAATRVLAQKGFHQTTVANIAAAAGVGVGTFYLHFPTKDALFDSVVEETVEHLKATIDAARAGATDPVHRMEAANIAFCRFADQNREVFRIVFGHAAAYHGVIRRAQGLFAADIEATVREGVSQGVFEPLPPALVAQAVVGMATQILSWWTEHQSLPIDTLHDTINLLALHGLAVEAPRRGGSPWPKPQQ